MNACIVKFGHEQQIFVNFVGIGELKCSRNGRPKCLYADLHKAVKLNIHGHVSFPNPQK